MRAGCVLRRGAGPATAGVRAVLTEDGLESSVSAGRDQTLTAGTVRGESQRDRREHRSNESQTQPRAVGKTWAGDAHHSPRV